MSPGRKTCAHRARILQPKNLFPSDRLFIARHSGIGEACCYGVEPLTVIVSPWEDGRMSERLSYEDMAEIVDAGLQTR